MYLKLGSIGIAALWLSSCASFLMPDCSKLTGDFERYRECQAKNGDREAQYNIGREAFAGGDYKTALKWLKMAARPNPGFTYIYVPPVGSQKYGTTKRIETHDAHPGHSGAQFLLAEMYQQGLGIERNLKTAEKYRKMASH